MTQQSCGVGMSTRALGLPKLLVAFGSLFLFNNNTAAQLLPIPALLMIQRDWEKSLARVKRLPQKISSHLKCYTLLKSQGQDKTLL